MSCQWTLFALNKRKWFPSWKFCENILPWAYTLPFGMLRADI